MTLWPRRSRPEHSRNRPPAERDASPVDARRLPWYSRMAGRRDLLGQAAILAVGGAVVVGVWVLTAWWSLTEQTRLAAGRGFTHPEVLFWSTDALAVACALVALAAAIDNRSAPLARLGYAVALGASAYFNAEAAAARLGEQLTPDALAMAAGVPLASFAALEIILAAIRATVRRWRGLPAPAGAPSLRLGRLLLGGVPELRRWRHSYMLATRTDAVPVPLAAELREAMAATVRESLAQAVTAANAVRADYSRQLAALPTPAPALDVRDVKAELGRYTAGVVDGRVRELAAELLADLDSRLDSRVAELRESLPRTTPAPRSRPSTRNGSGSGNGTTDTARMRAYWDEQRAAGVIPEGAELDRHVGRNPKDGHGRKMRAKWLAEESDAERELLTSGASTGA